MDPMRRNGSIIIAQLFHVCFSFFFKYKIYIYIFLIFFSFLLKSIQLFDK
uniref:Uncharacterized protein n=1 Tax=Brugia timori TaxID=42155 RepID=A0A0R3RDD8_9BILA